MSDAAYMPLGEAAAALMQRGYEPGIKHAATYIFRKDDPYDIVVLRVVRGQVFKNDLWKQLAVRAS